MPYKKKEDEQKHSKQYYLKHKDEIRKRAKKYQRDFPEVHRKASLKWSRNHAKEKAEYNKRNHHLWEGWTIENCLICGRFIPKRARKYCCFKHKELGRKL